MACVSLKRNVKGKQIYKHKELEKLKEYAKQSIKVLKCQIMNEFIFSCMRLARRIHQRNLNIISQDKTITIYSFNHINSEPTKLVFSGSEN